MPELLAGMVEGSPAPQKGSAELVPGQGVEAQPWVRPQLRTGSFCHGASPGQWCPCSALLSQAGWSWQGQGRRSTQGTPAGPAGARHSESGAVESEDQHEKEMENKEK